MSRIGNAPITIPKSVKVKTEGQTIAVVLFWAAMPAVEWKMTWPNLKNGRRSLYIASHAGARAWCRRPELDWIWFTRPGDR